MAVSKFCQVLQIHLQASKGQYSEVMNQALRQGVCPPWPQERQMTQSHLWLQLFWAINYDSDVLFRIMNLAKSSNRWRLARLRYEKLTDRAYSSVKSASSVVVVFAHAFRGVGRVSPSTLGLFTFWQITDRFLAKLAKLVNGAEKQVWKGDLTWRIFHLCKGCFLCPFFSSGLWIIL